VTHIEEPAPAGPATEALRLLRAWLGEAVADGEIVLGPPADDNAARIHLWPVAMLSDQTTRGGHDPQPVRFRARYAVAAAGPIDEAVRLLDRVLVATVGQEAVQLVIEPATAAVRPPSPVPNLTIQLDVPVRITPVPSRVSRVRGGLRLGGSALAEINGRLVGPDDVPLAGMTVAAPITGASVVSGDRGEFRLPALPGDRAIVLHISGHGLLLQVEVPPGTTDPVVVHCNIEEV
jgi:hypothetical protein